MSLRSTRFRGLRDLIRARTSTLVGYCQGAPLAPGNWCEPGLAIPLGLPVFIALPFAASGPLRTILGWRLGFTLPLAIIASALALTPAFVAWRRMPALRHSRMGYAVPIAVALFSFLVLYRRDFAGLTNYVGADGGVHVFQRYWFADTDPGTYIGFVSMYGLMYWIEQILRCSVYWSLCGAYYFGVLVVAAIPCLVAFVVLERFADRRAWYAGAIACAAVALTLAYTVVLPQQHYHQTDGFFPHLFALVPLMIAWLIDSAARARLWRWIGLIATVGFYRYTYGLNLADLLIALGALLFADSFGAGVPRLVRWLLRLASIPLTFAALVFLRRLEPLLASYGWIIHYDLRTVLWAQAFAILGIGVLVASTRWLSPEKQVLARVLRMPLVFAVVSTVIAYVGLKLPAPEPYYLLKYPVHAVVLASGALVVVVSFVAAWLVEGVVRRRWLGPAVCAAASLAACFAAFVHWRTGYAPFQPTFQERVFGHPPYSLNHPLADLAAWQRIARVLDKQHKKFGGYITSYWPMFNFMNAAFGYYNGGRAFWDHGLPRLEPGYCVFWDRGKVDWWTQPSDLPGQLRASIDRLNQRGDGVCVSYRAYWNHAVERTVCHVCE
jgi:hypothetical protein